MDIVSEIYLFNPENDMALANFTPYYQAPSDVVRMREELQLLPLWYAPEGAKVKVGCCAEFEDFLLSIRSLGLCLSVDCVSDWQDGHYIPWGWSPALVHQLLSGKVAADRLYSASRMLQLRELSGRGFAARMLQQVALLEGTCGCAYICHSMEEVESLLSELHAVVLKSPWSGSGRGVVKVNQPGWNTSVQGWVKHIFQTQQYIMVEPYYSRICDFAMEFYFSRDGKLSFVGYSLFDTDSHGNYKGNLLLPDSEIEKILSRWVSLLLLDQVREELITSLRTALEGVYEGYLGVDMMICSVEGKFLLHPCVEINLRMNMGVVSRLIYNRWLFPSVEGRFVVEYHSHSGEAYRFHGDMQSRYPLKCEGGQIKSGYLSLTPVTSRTRYQAYLIAGI